MTRTKNPDLLVYRGLPTRQQLRDRIRACAEAWERLADKRERTLVECKRMHAYDKRHQKWCRMLDEGEYRD